MFLLFLKIMFTDFVAEMGDKTQLMLLAMTSRYKLRDIILGTAAAILVLNGIAVLAGGIIGELIPDYVIKLIAAAAFLFFSFTSISGSDEEEEDSNDKGKFAFAPLTVFCTFFIAELGDKTQLTALTFGANEGLQSALIVWLACSVGLFAADIIGLLVGYLLKSKTPDGFLSILAFVLFAIFGISTLKTGLNLIPDVSINSTPIIIAITIIFLVACATRYYVIRKKSH